MDEADFLTINAQAALRNVIESFSKVTRFIFTCNYVERIIDPIQSRTTVYEVFPPSKAEVAKRCVYILNEENVSFDKETLVSIINQTYPDTRKTLNLIQSCIKQGKLELNKKLINQKQVIDEIVELISSKDSKAFNKIRQIVADSNIRDYNEIYRALYDNVDKLSNAVGGIVVIADSQYQSVMAPDKEICFMGCIANLLKLN